MGGSTDLRFITGLETWTTAATFNSSSVGCPIVKAGEGWLIPGFHKSYSLFFFLIFGDGLLHMVLSIFIDSGPTAVFIRVTRVVAHLPAVYCL